jgi:hypothetical protein
MDIFDEVAFHVKVIFTTNIHLVGFSLSVLCASVFTVGFVEQVLDFDVFIIGTSLNCMGLSGYLLYAFFHHIVLLNFFWKIFLQHLLANFKSVLAVVVRK